MGRHLRLSVLIASACLAFSGAIAQVQRSALGLPEKEKRRLLAPVIRAATDCIAKAIQPKDTAVEPDPARVLSSVSEGVAQCRDQIATMTAEHDRLYGPGTGQAFVNGAYLEDLPRAVLARVSPPNIGGSRRGDRNGRGAALHTQDLPGDCLGKQAVYEALARADDKPADELRFNYDAKIPSGMPTAIVRSA